MITFDDLEKKIKSKEIANSYLFCGQDEELIKEGIKKLAKPYLANGLDTLNYMKFDGNNLNVNELINACETMPFMGEKKVIVVYRANFLKEKTDSSLEKTYKEIKDYLKDIPDYSLLIFYYVFHDKRETPKKNKKILALDKITTVVHCDKLKRDRFIKKVQEIFQEKKGSIGNIELRYFCEKMPNNFEIINNEVEKLVCYTNGRDIKKSDIDKLAPSKSEEDIFDLVDLISQRKIDKAIDIMDEILFKADQHMLIVISIENQFRKLYRIKTKLSNGSRLDDIKAELKLPNFVCEKLINLSKKFSLRQLGNLIKLCVESETRLKSGVSDKTMELEMLLVNTLSIKR